MIPDSNNQSSKYGAVAQFFHWATAIAVMAAFILGPGGSEQHVYSVSRDFERQWHETLGLVVLALSILRIVWRSFDRHPQTSEISPFMAKAANLVQMTLYLLLFAVPFTAIFGAWLEGHPLTMVASLHIQSPVATAHGVGAAVSNIHTLLGDAILWLAGFHALAAIFHHVFLKDGVLNAMLPQWAVRVIDVRRAPREWAHPSVRAKME